VFIHAKVDKVDNSVMTAIGYFEQRWRQRGKTAETVCFFNLFWIAWPYTTECF